MEVSTGMLVFSLVAVVVALGSLTVLALVASAAARTARRALVDCKARLAAAQASPRGEVNGAAPAKKQGRPRKVPQGSR